ncbi:uncharacterized protein LOC691286 isoform X2 [Rattus norvegicus]|uniref:uncharacterized protein LOC691286 isoform 2 n=1 Tax=Rattus norvegicus TaxID=10116 RepID=UPI0003D0DEAB|nr:uncharacterized protein LOC691286 isoform X2 [Rattus norvegicus]|eukprot:XP_008765935.1 PREDICTED: uncharacterized protein LOC691286 isoform X2 [Rattus norvegicus]
MLKEGDVFRRLGCKTSDFWEITMNELEEKEVDEFSSSGLKCPTCFSMKGRECRPTLKWCSTDKINCVEFSGIVNTGVDNIPIQLMKCITVEQCKDTVTTYMGFSISNKSEICKSAVRNGARIRAPTPIFLILFLKKLLH